EPLQALCDQVGDPVEPFAVAAAGFDGDERLQRVEERLLFLGRKGFDLLHGRAANRERCEHCDDCQDESHFSPLISTGVYGATRSNNSMMPSPRMRTQPIEPGLPISACVCEP